MGGDERSELELEEETPANAWDRNVVHRALDELFSLARQYRSTKDFGELLRFIGRFRFYSPFNAMLIHAQMKGARYVAPPHRWQREYQRVIRHGSRPIVILQPRDPVLFVFDVSDTEPMPGAPPLPREVTHPFEVRNGTIARELELTIENAARDGVEVREIDAGSQSAGEISPVNAGRSLKFMVKRSPRPEFTVIPVRYQIQLNSKHSREAKYATLAHELGHLYCGHVGTPNERWWPDRRGLALDVREVEAESICYLLCCRLGIDNPSDEYVPDYLKREDEIPPMSLDCVMKACGLIERMGRVRLKLRGNDESD